MKNEIHKQNTVDVAIVYLDNLLGMGGCGYSVSTQLRLCCMAITDGDSPSLDNAAQRHLLKVSALANQF
jgi:hypothetical protein